MSMMRRAQGVNIEWLTVPDVLENAKKTLQLFYAWHEHILFPKAFVIQDGAEDIDIPFHLFKCLFIGGSTEFKLSHTSYDIVQSAKAKGKQIHMGRVNTDKRLRHAMTFGCDSVDGTGYVRFRKREILPALHFIHGLDRQSVLF